MSHVFSSCFSPGRLFATQTVVNAVPRDELMLAVTRHLSCDWGNVSIADKRKNDYALSAGERLLSAYYSTTGCKFWIITEPDRSATTILLPEEY